MDEAYILMILSVNHNLSKSAYFYLYICIYKNFDNIGFAFSNYFLHVMNANEVTK